MTHRPAFVLSLVLALGIATAKFIVIPPWVWLIVVIPLLIAFLYRRSTWLIYALLFFWGALSMSFRSALPPDSIAFLSWHSRQNLEWIEGVITSDIEERGWVQGKKTVFLVDVSSLTVKGRKYLASGKVQVEMYQKPAWPLAYGQKVLFKGKLHHAFQPKDGAKFSYRRYLHEQGIFWICSVKAGGDIKLIKSHQGNPFVKAAIWIKHGVRSIFDRYLSPRESGFLTAIVIGDKSHFPKDLREIFINTGTAHILAISGMNMAIVGGIMFFLLKLLHLPRAIQFGGTICFLMLYALISGWSPSVVRACLMTSVLLLAFALEEESDALNSLGVAAFILLLIDPKFLFDLGFQLSFAAVLAILVIYPMLEKFFKSWPEILKVSMSVSTAAWLGTAPLLFYHFGNWTPIAIIANIPIVPLADCLMALGLGLVICGHWFPWMATCIASCIKAVLSALIILAGWFNHLAGGA